MTIKSYAKNAEAMSLIFSPRQAVAQGAWTLFVLIATMKKSLLTLIKMNTFIDFLRDIYTRDYVGLDDDMPDHFEHWLGNLDGEEYIEYAEDYATKREAEAGLRALNNNN